MSGQQLRDALAVRMGKPTGRHNSGRFNTKQLLIDELVRLDQGNVPQLPQGNMPQPEPMNAYSNMSGQQLRDALAVRMGRPTGRTSSGRFNTKPLLIEELLRLDAMAANATGGPATATAAGPIGLPDHITLLTIPSYHLYDPNGQSAVQISQSGDCMTIVERRQVEAEIAGITQHITSSHSVDLKRVNVIIHFGLTDVDIQFEEREHSLPIYRAPVPTELPNIIDRDIDAHDRPLSANERRRRANREWRLRNPERMAEYARRAQERRQTLSA